MDGQNVALTIWEAEAKDNFGNITQYNLGNGLQTNKVFDQYTGMLTQIKTGTSSSQTSIQNLQYQYDDLYNITQRKDVLSNQQDLFTYDNFNRLTDIQTYKDADDPTTSITKHMAYDNVGNIIQKSDVGDITYGGQNSPYTMQFASPYAVSIIENNPNTITTPQNILYTSFNKVRKIITSDEDGSNAKELDFIYGADYGRRKTTYVVNNILITKKYYAFGNYEEAIDVASGISTKDYYIYGGDGVAAIYRITGTTTPDTMYYIHKDNLGSFDKVTNSSGAVVDSYSFDAWGNRRNTSDWTAAETNTNHLFSRGFTGHEHLDEFGLINMNGRCYDPLLGRVLSPDPELQDPANIQNYNRYSYCLNNPLKYTDPSGYSWNDCISTSFNNLLYNLYGSNYSESNQLWGSNDWDNMNRTSFFGGYNIGLDYGLRDQLVPIEGSGAGGPFLDKNSILEMINNGKIDLKDKQKYINLANTYNNDKLSTPGNDSYLETLIFSLFGIQKGDFDISLITTKTGGYGLTENALYVDLKTGDPVLGYFNKDNSELHISPGLLSPDQDVIFNGTVGHELIHAYHYYEFGKATNLYYTERYAYQFSFNFLINNGKYNNALKAFYTCESIFGFWGTYPSQYNIPLVYKFSLY